MNSTPQRENRDGHPVALGDAWILRKGDQVARCTLFTHQLGFELLPVHDGPGAIAGVPLVRGGARDARAVEGANDRERVGRVIVSGQDCG